MRRWLVGLALTWGFTAVVVQAQQVLPAVPPDAPVQVQVQIAPAAPVQIQVAPNGAAVPAQVQVFQNARIAMDVAPGYIGGVNRFTASDAIVVGRVVAFEPMDVQTPPVANQPNANYRIAIVQVTETIHGIKKDTQTIRVGFVAPANGDPNVGGGAIGNVQILPAIQPGGGIAIGRRPFIGGSIQLQMGQDGIFKLNKHFKENFYVAPNYTSFVNRQNNAGFDNEVRAAKQLSKVMGNPVAALKAEDAQERVLAAAILVNKYRNPNNMTGTAMKQEPIDAEESKLILKAIAQSDWSINRNSDALPFGPEMFGQLGVSQKDGYSPMNVRNQQDIYKAMQTWLNDNTDKYRIQKFVADPNAKPGVGVGGVTDLPLIQPGVRPIKIQPIKGKVQILPAPVPQPAPIAPPQLDEAPVQNAVPVPLRRQ